MSEYCPWEELGLTEVEYWKQRYIKAQKSLSDYETDWRKMRKYYDAARVKMNALSEAIEIIKGLTSTGRELADDWTRSNEDRWEDHERRALEFLAKHEGEE